MEHTRKCIRQVHVTSLFSLFSPFSPPSLPVSPFLSFLFCGAVDQIQGLGSAKQVLYHKATSLAPHCQWSQDMVQDHWGPKILSRDPQLREGYLQLPLSVPVHFCCTCQEFKALFNWTFLRVVLAERNLETSFK